jgi:phytoene/squalene synthetase
MTLAACAALVERGDPDRFLAAMAAPAGARAVLLPLYAYNLELARAPWLTAEPLIAEMRLQWWRDGLAEVAAGRPARAHEVMEPLAGAIAAGAPVGVLDAMAEARRRDVHREGFVDAGALWDYLDATGGGLMWAAVRALGGQDEAGARAMGRAGAMAAWLMAVPALAGRGWEPLPAGADPGVLAREALAMIAPARGPGVPALRAAWRAGAILQQAAAEPGRVRQGRLGTSEFRRRASLLWRVWRGV